ncbi:MAG: hypothetical protein JNM72_15830 [Deltaproteobacteria bacterium]|nr:hypothetical protein [Deltaproteobacteria bacterium]
MSSVHDGDFEKSWGTGDEQRLGGPYLASVAVIGHLTGTPQPPNPSGGHVYVVRRVGPPLTTLSGRPTDVIYIGQGIGGRVTQLWSGGHSIHTKLKWARAAHHRATGEKLHVTVDVQRADRPELREVELLNAFLWEHGQMPALNGRHEGWLPRRVLSAVAAEVMRESSSQVKQVTKAEDGPRTRLAGLSALYTAVHFYGTPSQGKSWRWRGSLLWVFPEDWRDDDTKAALKGEFNGEFVLLGRPDTPEPKGWIDVPAAILGNNSWKADVGSVKLRRLGPSRPDLGTAEQGHGSAHTGNLRDLVDELTTKCQESLPRNGVEG